MADIIGGVQLLSSSLSVSLYTRKNVAHNKRFQVTPLCEKGWSLRSCQEDIEKDDEDDDDDDKQKRIKEHSLNSASIHQPDLGGVVVEVGGFPRPPRPRRAPQAVQMLDLFRLFGAVCNFGNFS